MKSTYGFDGDNGFVFVHAIISYSLLVLTIVLNILVFVLVRVSKHIDSFRYVFYTYCVTNIIFSFAFSISLTQWAKTPELAIFFPTGPFAHNTFITPHVWRIQNLLYFFVMCLLCATFVYRYLVVAEPNSHRFRTRILTAMNFLPVPLWFVDSLLARQPGTELRKRVNQEFGARFAVDFERIHLIAVDTNVAEINPLQIIGVFLSLVQLGAMLYTGLRIYITILKSVGSQRSKVMERSAFRLLLSQAINPILFLHAPTIANIIQAEVVILPDSINRLSCILMHFFTVTNPLLNLFLSRDLSNSLKYFLMRRKKSSISVVQS